MNDLNNQQLGSEIPQQEITLFALKEKATRYDEVTQEDVFMRVAQGVA